MKENTNKAIVVNSLYLYIKLLITTICGLFSTRFALQALGVEDFGLFSVVGSIISLIAIFNTIMLATSNRFISIAIGRGILKEINEQFNINLCIHIILALVTILIALPIGNWYISNHLQYNGCISNALWVFHFGLLGSAISFVGVPYNGLLMAKERFWVFCTAESVSAILKLMIAFSLINYFEAKLLIYALSQAGLTAMVSFSYWAYCRIYFKNIVKFHIVNKIDRYKEVLAFSSWVAYGAIATVGKNQGAAILVNTFFNTIMNAALGLANTVHSLLLVFANSISQPLAPQVTKNYAIGNFERCSQLLVMSTKYTFIVVLCFSAPILVNPNYILSLWLGNIPPYAVNFTILITVDTLICSLNSGISNIIFASGKIKLYQVSINTLRLFAIGIAYIVLRSGGGVYSLLYTYIVCSVIIFFLTQQILHKTLNFDNSILFRKSYIPSIIIVVLFTPFCFLHLDFHPLIQIVLSELYLLMLIVLIGTDKKEKDFLVAFIKKRIKR